MKYYKIFIKESKNSGYFVYWRTEEDIPLDVVPAAASDDGHILYVWVENVEYTEEISKEEYYEYMTE